MRSLKIGFAFCFVLSVSSAASAQDAGTPFQTDASAVFLPPSIDAGFADTQVSAPEVAAAVPIAAPVPAPEPSIDSKRFEELNNRVTSLVRQNHLLEAGLGATKETVALLEERLSLLEEDTRYKLAAAGLALSFGTGSGSGSALKIQGNLKGFSGFYYIGTGGGLAWSMAFHVNRVRVSPLGFGFMAYQDSGNAFTTRWLKRTIDIVLPISVDVRVWDGFTVGAQIAWFIPNPVDVAIAGEDAGKSSVDNAAQSSIYPTTDVPEKALDDSGEVVSRAFGDALKSPRIELAAKWTFE